MGNNTSSLPNRRKSVSRRHGTDYSKSDSQHSDQSSPTSTKTSTGSHQLPINTDNGYPPPYKPKAIVTPNVFTDHLGGEGDYFGKFDKRKSIDSSAYDETRKLGDSADADLGAELGQVLSSGTFDDDYDVDDDLLNKDSSVGTANSQGFNKSNKGNDGKLKNVLVKFVDYDGQNSAGASTYDDTQVYIIGSFNNWSKKIKLYRDFDGIYKMVIQLPLGIFKIKFLVNNEVKYSEDLPIATDKSGNVVNWFEVDNIEKYEIIDGEEVFEAGILEQHKISNNKRKSSTSFHPNNSTSQISFSEFNPIKHETYSQEIPEMFHQSDEILPVDERFLHENPIPELPVYLNNTYLNKHFNTHHNSSTDAAQLNKKKMTSSGLNSHIIPHVNLNHLLTSNIKNNVLSVACTTRYSGKFITQIMYSPSELVDE